MATAVLQTDRKPLKASRLWWHVHHWVGFKLSLFMSFICLTGSLAVLSNEMDWLMLPSLRVSPSTVHDAPAWDKIVESATRYPGVKQIQIISDPTASAFAAQVMVVFDNKRFGYLHIHPTTGVVQGEGHWISAQRILRNMHRHLNLPGWIGIPIVTSLSLLLLTSLVTSFVVYKKWWRGFLRMPRKRDARTWWGDFHRLAGVWSLWFVALIALTGLWYFVEQMGGYIAPPEPEIVAQAPETPSELGALFPASYAAARAVDPDLKIQSIRFPTKKSGAFVFGGEKSAILVRPRANTVWTEAATAKVLGVYDGRDLSVHGRISEMADPLHFGYFGGYWTKIPWFLFGLLLTGLSVSGMVIYAQRIGRELRETVAFKRGWKIAWSGMGIWAWPAAAAIIIALVEMRRLFFASAE